MSSYLINILDKYKSFICMIMLTTISAKFYFDVLEKQNISLYSVFFRVLLT